MSSEGDETVERSARFPFLPDPFEDADGDGTPDIYTGGPVGAPNVELPDSSPEPATEGSSAEHETMPLPAPPEPEPSPQPSPRTPKVEQTHVRDDAKVEDFLRNVLAQVGDTYKRGAEAKLSDDDPDQWDGSELVEWAANRAGVMINDGAANQFRQLDRQDGDISVEQALRTPGALLYTFSSDPVSGRPAHASTAISLGDGRIVDIDPEKGVRIIDAKDFTFTHAAVMPGFTDAHDPGAGAIDVVDQALEAHGIRDVPDVADTPEITAMGDRAAQLRHQFEDQFGKEELDGAKQIDALKDQIQVAEARGKDAQGELKFHEQQISEIQQKIDKFERDASQAQTAGRSRDAEEALETAAKQRVVLRMEEGLADSSRSEVEEATQQAAGLTQERDAAVASLQTLRDQRPAAEKAIDAIEDKVRYEREANAQRANADELDREAADLRAQGDTAGADARAAASARARAAADAAQTQADDATVDGKALEYLGSGSGDAGAEAPSVPDTPEIDALAERAADLRAAYLDTIARDPEGNERIDVFKQKLAAEDDVTRANQAVAGNVEQAQNARSRADELDRKALDADAAGLPQKAAEYREDAQEYQATANAADARVARFRAEAESDQQRVDELEQRHEVLSAREGTASADLQAAEKAVDVLEDRVRFLREANTQQSLADTYERDAQLLRGEGHPEEAAAREQLAVQARAAASTAQSQAAAQPVDEHALEILEHQSVAQAAPDALPGADDLDFVPDPPDVDDGDDETNPDPTVARFDDLGLDAEGGALPAPQAAFDTSEVTSDAPPAEGHVWDEGMPDDGQVATGIEMPAPAEVGVMGEFQDGGLGAEVDGVPPASDDTSFSTDEPNA